MGTKELLRKAIQRGAIQSTDRSSTVISVSGTTDSAGTYTATYTAPKDGYAELCASGQSIEIQTASRVEAKAKCLFAAVYRRIKKGDVVTMMVYNLEHLYYSQFVPLVGGGNNLLFEKLILGGALCLKTTFENLQNALQEWRSRIQLGWCESVLNIRMNGGLKRSFRRLMGLCALTRLLKVGEASLFPPVLARVPRARLTTRNYMCRLKRAKPFKSLLRTFQCLSSTSFLQFPTQDNLTIGGAYGLH